MERDEYGTCVECGSEIKYGRLEAHPYADECIDCAEFDEHRRAHR
jgi:RNA polymerase-binding transcription factor DksA